MTEEGKVKAAVRAELIKRRVYPWNDLLAGKFDLGQMSGFFYMPVAGPMAVHGIHDFVGCWHGRFFTIETKAPKEKVDATAHQRTFMEVVHHCDGFSYIGVRSAEVVATIEEDILERLGRCHG